MFLAYIDYIINKQIRFGTIDVKVTKTTNESSLHRLIRMVKDAEGKKAPMERIADKWASWLVPVALLIAVAAYLWTGNIIRAVTVLVVFCPCALVLATPTAKGKALILTAAENKICGLVSFSDTLRRESRKVISYLRRNSIETVLLTGDNIKSAEYYAARLGVNEVKAGLLPEDKLAYITRKQQEGHTVCMIGDGINDAPALKTANIGVAMADIGSDITVEAANIALMHDDISLIPYLKNLADATVQTIKISITVSLCINFIAILLSLQGVLTPTTGALVHNIGSCLVVLFAASLYHRAPPNIT